MTKLDNLIKIIDQEIKNTEEMDISYKEKEMNILEDITSKETFMNPYNEKQNEIADILLSLIITNKMYSDIEEVLDIFNEVEDTINSFDYSSVAKIFGGYILARREDYRTEEFRNILKNISLGKFHDNINELLNYVDVDDLQVIVWLKSIEEKRAKLVKDIEQDIENTVGLLIDKDTIKRELKINSIVNENYNRLIKSMANLTEIEKISVKIKNYCYELKSKNEKNKREKNKSLKKLQELKKLILLTENQKEITNVKEINSCIEHTRLKTEVLRYISDKNKQYYIALEEEYDKLKRNSLVNYTKVFADKNINFKTYSLEEQKSILSVDMDLIEKLFSFLEKINFEFNKDIINIILSTKEDIIDNIENYVKKGIFTYEFVKENINIILENGLYETLIKNINILLKEKMNPVDLEKESLIVLISDSELIVKNIEIIKRHNLNVTTRNLKNYLFLIESNLEEKLNGFEKTNIDLNENINMINFDDNALKRIKICKNLGIEIYEGNELRKGILNGNLFFIPDSKLDEFIFDENPELILK